MAPSVAPTQLCRFTLPKAPPPCQCQQSHCCALCGAMGPRSSTDCSLPRFTAETAPTPDLVEELWIGDPGGRGAVRRVDDDPRLRQDEGEDGRVAADATIRACHPSGGLALHCSALA